jgi:hypothetical protein
MSLYYLVRKNTNERMMNDDGKYTIVTGAFPEEEVRRQAWLRHWSDVEKIDIKVYQSKFGVV